MQKGKVNIAQGYPETLSNLKIFQETQKIEHPEKKLKTLADAIDFAVEQAERVPGLEKENSELREENEKLKDAKLDFTYDELEALFNIANAVDESTDDEFQKNCNSGAQKLYQLMKMKE